MASERAWEPNEKGGAPKRPASYLFSFVNAYATAASGIGSLASSGSRST